MSARASAEASLYEEEPPTQVLSNGASKVTYRPAQITTIEQLIAEQNQTLLLHRYFELCRTASLSRAQMIAIIKELYCFSTFFERILTLRVARHSSNQDARTLDVARRHLEVELGHVDLFKECLLTSGVSLEEISRLVPRTLTKALYGYLLATVLHETDQVASVAVTHVMESIGSHFFRATSQAMKVHDLSTGAVDEHAEEDDDHAALGIDLVATFDDQTMRDSRRVICDLYRLMSYVLDDWLEVARAARAGHSA
jgi:pyrroloquinoline quinone (PQQ) biosynthesis protein C